MTSSTRIARPWAILVRRAVVDLGWIVVVASGGVCLLRVIHADQSTFEIATVSLTPLVLLPAWPVAVVAACLRHWRLFAVTLVVVLCDVWWEGPVLAPIWRAPPARPGSTAWVLYDANIAQNNFQPVEIADEIMATHPDVISLEELTPMATKFLIDRGVLTSYRWHLVEPRGNAGGMGIWARVPLTGLGFWTSDGTQVEIEGWLHPPGQPKVRLDVVHVYAPVGFDQPATWRQQLVQLQEHLRAEPRPLVVAGDFNATSDVGPFQSILGIGLSDAAVLAGKGWEMTWPRNQAWVMPYLRIDHVLLSSRLTVTSYRLGEDQGSDHRPLIVDITDRASPNHGS